MAEVNEMLQNSVSRRIRPFLICLVPVHQQRGSFAPDKQRWVLQLLE